MIKINSFTPKIILSALILINFEISEGSNLRQFFNSSGTSSANKTIKRVFITSTGYNGNLGGLAGADAKCQAQADATSLGGTWMALVSSSTKSLATRLNSIEYESAHNLKGEILWRKHSTQMINSQTDVLGVEINMPFQNFLQSNGSSPPTGPLYRFAGVQITNEYGSALNMTFWTGSNSNGTNNSNCSDWTNSSVDNGVCGDSSSSTSTFISSGTFSCSSSRKLLCFEK